MEDTPTLPTPGRYVERMDLTAHWYVDLYKRYDVLVGQSIFIGKIVIQQIVLTMIEFSTYLRELNVLSGCLVKMTCILKKPWDG